MAGRGGRPVRRAGGAMAKARVQEIIRQFPENGLRLLVHDPHSVRGLLRLAGVRLGPVLPVVFYTGTRSWGALDSLPELIERGEEFRGVTPALAPLFVNLPALPEARLESAGGYFGRVLELVQQRRAERATFADLLRRVVGHLERMQRAERLRWLELLSYIGALVYHERAEPEREGWRQEIEASVRTDKDRQEVTPMVRPIAEALR